MITIEEELLAKKRELEKLIADLEKRKSDYPGGSLKIARNEHGNSYYHCNGGEGEKNPPEAVYIRKKDMDLARKLAQKGYERKVLQWAENASIQLQKLLNCYSDALLDTFYEGLTEERRQLVTPVENSICGIRNKWNADTYIGKKIREDSVFIMTEQGERVRSKSEKIIADKLSLYKIPYKYECPLDLEGYGVVYPDFTVFNARLGKIYYWEHMGMMDNSEYVSKTMSKLETYMNNGMFPGKQLLITFETQKSGLNMSMVENMIQEYLV